MRFTPEQIERLAYNATDGADGHTEYAFDKPGHAGRYIVGGISNGIVFSAQTLYLEPVASRAKITEWAEQAAQGAETLGLWTESDLVYVDAGDTYNALELALQVAQYRGELAIYDRVENVCIPVKR